MIKNRTIIAIICIVLAVVMCFGIAPIVSNLFNGTQSVVILTVDVAQGTQIQKSMLSTAQVSRADTFSFSYVGNPDEIIGKYAKTYLYSGIVTSDMFEDEVTDSDAKLLSLQSGESAMSITIQSLAGGLSNKIRSGDIVSIVTVDDDEDEATIMSELRYVEVLSLTTSDGLDVTNNQSEDLAATITIKLIDDRQITKLLDCEEGTLHVVLVSRDEDLSKEYLALQKEYFVTLDEEEEQNGEEQGNDDNVDIPDIIDEGQKEN